jgi:NAD dependent epimerase/dehydratase
MSFWANKNVVVTGAGGFIGSHLVERLLCLGANVTGFVRYNSRNDTGLLEFVDHHQDKLRVITGDIREPATVHGLLEDADVVFHLAALVGIPYSYVHANEVVEVNGIGTLNVLTAAKEHRVGKVIVTSTSEVYGTALYVPIDEKHPKQPQSPYSASKIASDAIALSFHSCFDLPVAVVRPFNTYGPRQSDRAIIPVIICQALTKHEIRMGNTTPTRDFTFVLDTVNGMIRIAESDRCVGEEVNLGTGCEISIGDLAEKIGRLVGHEVVVKQDGERLRPPKSEVERLLSQNTRAIELTGWRPQIDLDEGLRRTIDWIRVHLDFYDPDRYRI